MRQNKLEIRDKVVITNEQHKYSGYIGRLDRISDSGYLYVNLEGFNGVSKRLVVIVPYGVEKVEESFDGYQVDEGMISGIKGENC